MEKAGSISEGFCWKPHGIGGIFYLPQGELNKLLREKATATGLVTVRFEETLVRIEQNGSGVNATTSRGDAETIFQAPYLVGADGGQSAIRKLLGIPLKGQSWPEKLISTDFLFENPNVDTKFPTQFIVHPIY
ncbi:hypothetical protein N7463_009201 [Penicillium fimorum]|uniref:FAD-binding domain-containing protein n=1 Tax=Penicillium fimorum TaxID=1882269 RepID=A0A9X0C4I6_9EURO|nr:hypothetical protein N7463_009201 [Penicillium fimorum]